MTVPPSSADRRAWNDLKADVREAWLAQEGAYDPAAELARRRAEADRVHGPVCEGCGRRGCLLGCDPDCRA